MTKPKQPQERELEDRELCEKCNGFYPYEMRHECKFPTQDSWKTKSPLKVGKGWKKIFKIKEIKIKEDE